MKGFLPLWMCGFTLASPVRAEMFGGIDFPQGGSSFADRIASYTPGVPGPTGALFTNPADALGPPNHPGGNDAPGSVSLGVGGSIVVEFTNNLLTGSNDISKDLHIFEVGSDVEDTFVEISTDGSTWISVGKVFGATSSIDIDAFGITSADSFRFVRLTDDPNEGQTTGDSVGADIDAVGAIASSQIDDDPVLTIRGSGNTAYLDAILGQGAVAYWRLHEASGSSAVNAGSLGAAANGVYGLLALLDLPGLRAGSVDTALEFPIKSIDGRMVVTPFAMPTDAVTFSFLVRGQDDGQSFFFGYGASSSANEFTFSSNNGVFRSIIRGSILDHSGVDVLDGVPHHIAITWTEATGLMQAYVDGQLRATRTVSAGTPLTTGGVLALGQDLDSLTPPNYSFEASQSLVGTLDEVAVFDRVLSVAEIQGQHGAAFAPAGVTSAPEFFLEFQSAFGSSYSISQSPDLAGWGTFVSPIAGTGGKMRFPVKAGVPRKFFRLE